MTETIDKRFKRAKVMFSEDECDPDAERLDEAWLRLFGERREDSQEVGNKDFGDAIVIEYAGGRFAQIGPPRAGWTEIRVLTESVA